MLLIWFSLVAVMITAYVVFDGFDLGVGVLHLFIAKSDEERKSVIRTIGPVWDGNEVWLLAGGGTLYFAFPLLYASGFSGFYLPLMIVLGFLFCVELESNCACIWISLCGADCSMAVLRLPAYCWPCSSAQLLET